VAGRIWAPPLVAAVVRAVVATAVACSRSTRNVPLHRWSRSRTRPARASLARASKRCHPVAAAVGARGSCSRRCAVCCCRSAHLSLQRDFVIVARSIHSLLLVASSSSRQHRLAHGLRAFVALPPLELLADSSRSSIIGARIVEPPSRCRCRWSPLLLQSAQCSV
jgi:hypothetical protein